MRCSKHDEEMVEVSAWSAQDLKWHSKHICAVCDHLEELRSKNRGERIARLLEDEMLGGL